MSNNKNKSIVVFNPVSGYGHLDSWNLLFIKIFLELGWNVDVISGGGLNVEEKLVNDGLQDTRRLKIHSHPSFPVEKKSKREKITVGQGLGLTSKIITARSNSLRNRVWRKDNIQFVSLCAIHFIKYYFLAKLKKYLKKSFVIEDGSEYFQHIESVINELDIEPDLIFHMYLDALNFKQSNEPPLESNANKKWAGLRFSPCRDDLMFYDGHPEIKGVCFLDDSWKVYFDAKDKDVIFAALPDIASSSLKSRRSKIALQILARANNRKIVFLGGMIGWRKNIDTWYKLVKLADPTKWFFLQVGEIIPAGMSAADLYSMYAAIYTNKENLMIIPAYLEDESSFNELISISDIIYAVYRNFPNSSNMLTKAAAFCKPIIVSSGHLMAQRVEKYAIGKIVDERDSSKIYKAIEEMPDPIDFSRNFDNYNQDFNEVALKNKLSIFLNSLSQ